MRFMNIGEVINVTKDACISCDALCVSSCTSECTSACMENCTQVCASSSGNPCIGITEEVSTTETDKGFFNDENYRSTKIK